MSGSKLLDWFSSWEWSYMPFDAQMDFGNYRGYRRSYYGNSSSSVHPAAETDLICCSSRPTSSPRRPINDWVWVQPKYKHWTEYCLLKKWQKLVIRNRKERIRRIRRSQNPASRYLNLKMFHRLMQRWGPNEEDERNPGSGMKSIAEYVDKHIMTWSNLMKGENSAYSVNSRDEYGGTPLLAACAFGVTGAASTLIEYGANVDQCDDEGYTPLWCAVYLGEASCARILIGSGAKVNVTSPPCSPLHAASYAGRLKCIKLLLRHGAKVNSCHGLSLSRTPLHEACHCEILKQLQGFGVCTSTPMQYFIKWAQTVNALVNAGANVNFRDDKGNTPLHYICRNAPFDFLIECIMHLISYGANLGIVNNEEDTPITLHRRVRQENGRNKTVEKALRNAEKQIPVPTLQFLCTLRVRRCLNANQMSQDVQELPLPKSIKNQIKDPLGKYQPE